MEGSGGGTRVVSAIESVLDSARGEGGQRRSLERSREGDEQGSASRQLCHLLLLRRSSALLLMIAGHLAGVLVEAEGTNSGQRLGEGVSAYSPKYA